MIPGGKSNLWRNGWKVKEAERGLDESVAIRTRSDVNHSNL